MVGIYTNVHYWLVDHPTITDFTWKQGKTFGGSTQFLVTTVLSYLSLTAIFHMIMRKLQLKSTAKTGSTSTKSQPSSRRVLRVISAVHSLSLMILSFVMAMGCTLSTMTQMPNIRWIFCFPPNRTSPNGPVFFWGYIFYLSKILEFIDTLLILLNKEGKRRLIGKPRLTFLDVYHHAFTIVVSYYGVELSQSLLPVGVITNSTVHVVMYGYYFLCSIGRRPTWKKSVTDCQILQFQFAFATSMVMLWFHFTSEEGCLGIRVWTFSILYAASLLFLFTDFRTKNYVKNRKSN